MAVVMGTAGHIDHGKTSLVRALTGIDCDRLGEEKRRGITIELGFAYFTLPGGERLGVVDMPGHERFVRNMVAGAAGIDFVLLVIAADEGVMPQTREHLEICSLLGVRQGMVALTKIDMVDAELLDMAREDVQGFLAGTFLENAPVFPVSSTSGQGLEELRQAIFAQGERLSPRQRGDLFRLPVDRVFTMKGHGTVVTGTLISGQAKLGDDVVLLPRLLESRIRGIQSHGQETDMAVAGRRTSINLHGLDVDQIERGDVVARPGSLFPSKRWIVGLTCLSSSPRGLRQRGEIHFHHGAKEISARLYFYDRDRLEPGQTALAEIRFTTPLAAVFGDRCVVRAFSPLRTVAGGGVLFPLDSAPRRREIRPDMQARILALPEASPEDQVLTQLELSGSYGCGQAQLTVLTGLPGKALEKALQSLSGKGLALCYDKDARLWVPMGKISALAQLGLEQAAAFHKKDPLKPGMAKGVLLGAWGKTMPPKLAHLLLERLLKAGTLVVEGDLLRLAGHKVSLGSDQSALRDTLLKAYAEQPLSPPNLKEVLEKLGVDRKEAMPVMNLLLKEKVLIKVTEEQYFPFASMEILQEKIRVWFQSHDDLTPGDFKELSGGLSRKYIISLLEYFDKERFTLRVGDKRQLRGKGNA